MLYKAYLYFCDFFINYIILINLFKVFSKIIIIFYPTIKIASGIIFFSYYTLTEKLYFVFVKFIKNVYLFWLFRYSLDQEINFNNISKLFLNV